MSDPSDTPPLRLALLGAGTFARSAHHAALTAPPLADRVSVSLIWSRHNAAAAALAAQYSPTPSIACHAVSAHPTPLASAAAALDSHRPVLDAVVVALPPEHAPAFAAMAATKGLHVLMEKPLALHVQAARELLRSVEGRGVVFGVAENFRFEPAFRMAAAMLSETCGSVVGVRLVAQVPMAEGSKYGRGWRLQLPAAGMLLDGVVHYVAGMRVVVGADVESVSATCGRHAGWFEGCDTVSAELRFGNGVSGTVFVTYAGKVFEWSLSVVGTEGVVVVERATGGGYRVKAERGGEVKLAEAPFAGIDAEFEAFADSCEIGKVHPDLDARAAFNDLACVEAMYESSKRGVRVTVER